MATRHSSFPVLGQRGRAARRTRAGWRVIAAAAAVIAGVGSATAASAQSLCGNRAPLLERLESAYGEKRQAIGLSADGGVLEILASSDGSWTILITYPGRPTCMLAAGQAWENLALLLVGKPA